MPVSTAQQLFEIKDNCTFRSASFRGQIALLRNPFQQSYVLSEFLQFYEYCIPSLTRLRNVLVFRLNLTSASQTVSYANHSLQSVCVCICDSSESVADALSEPSLISIVNSHIDSLTLFLSQQACVCVLSICRFACVRSEPAISFVYVCLILFI